MRVTNEMTHSFLIVGGTIKKRRIQACGVATPDFSSGSSGLPTRNIRVRSFNSLQLSKGSLSDAWQTREPQKEGATDRFDTTTLEPEEDKQTITIDQVRDLQHQLSLKPYASDKKVGIIPEAQRMTTEAQNALLKTLEEPPAHSVLILTAPSTRILLPTIVSRCQIVRLRAEIDLDLESEEYQKGVEEFLELLRSGGGERLAWIEENKPVTSYQLPVTSLLDIWISVLRDLLLANSGCQPLSLNPTMKQFSNLTIDSKLSNSSSLCSDRESSQILTDALEKTIKTKNLIAKTNINPRLALEVLLLDLPVLQNEE